MSANADIKVGDRVRDTLIHQDATVTKVVKSAILPDWTVAYLITYDEPPPMEYNMGAVNSMQFSKWIKPLKKKP